MKNCCDTIKRYFRKDKIWFDIFLLTIFIQFGLLYYALRYGNPARMVKGFNPDHLACGEDLGLKEYPFIYFPTPIPQYLYRTVCVAGCPQKDPDTGKIGSLFCQPNSLVTSCKQNYSMFDPSKQVIYYETFPYKNNICIPTTFNYFNKIQDSILPPQLHQFLNDIYSTQFVLFGISFLSFILSYLFLKLIKIDVNFFIWVLLIGMLFGIGSGGVYFFYKYRTVSILDSYPDPLSQQFRVTLDYIQQVTNQTNPLLYLIASFVFVILFLISCWLAYKRYRQIQYLAGLVKLTEEFLMLRSSFGILFVVFIILIIVLTIDAKIFIYLLSCSNVIEEPNLKPFEQLEITLLTKIFLVIMLYITLWHVQFLMTCLNFLILNTLTSWFKLKMKDTNSQGPQQQKNKKLTFNERNIQQLYQNSIEFLFNHLPQIAKGSFSKLNLSMIKFLYDIFHDSIEGHKNWQKLCCFCESYYSSYLRAVEDVVFIEISEDPSLSLSQAQQKVLITLKDVDVDENDPNSQNQKKNDIQEKFERIRNLAMLFGLLGTAIISILSMVISRGVFEIIPYYRINLYNPTIPIAACGLIGVSVSYLIFSLISTFCEGIFYLFYKYENQEDKFPELKEFDKDINK